MKLTLAKVYEDSSIIQQVALHLTLLTRGAEYLCKQFGPRSGPTFWLMLLKKSSIQSEKYGTIIKCKGLIKAVLENQKLIKMHYFANM